MEQTQWWEENDLREKQLQQAAAVLDHAFMTTAFYGCLYQDAGINPKKIKSWDDWSRVPIVSRKTLQASGDAWYSNGPPKDHGALLHHFTSGSTGRPLRSMSTTLTHLFKLALVLRNHQWALRDTRLKAAFIHEAGDDAPAEGRQTAYWQESLIPLITTGPALRINVRLSVEEQYRLIRDFEPAYIIGYPSVISALAQYCILQGLKLPFLRQIGTFGEVLESSCRDQVRKAWGVAVVDGYSAKEMGPIALQCPENECYHIQSDVVLAEILDAEGRECAPGEVGRVVLTSLHNFAAPMIRYEIGDFAEKGGPCTCGRKLPTINRILGRQRNMLKFPDGSHRWPSLTERGLQAAINQGLPMVQQFQLIQHSLDRLEARLVVERRYTSDEERRVTEYLRSQLGNHWNIQYSYPASIERGLRGKYEDFLSYCN